MHQWKITRDLLMPLGTVEGDLDNATLKLPSGLYTTFRTYDYKSRVVGLNSHLARLFAPAQNEGIRPARSQTQLREILRELIKEVDADETRIRLILDMTIEKGTFYVLAQPFELLPEQVYRKGVSASLSEKSRKTPTLKKTNFILESDSDRKSKPQNIFEILLTKNGCILEGMTSNFFYVKKGNLCTAAHGILNGVTRRTVISTAKKKGYRVVYKGLRIGDLNNIEEAFITSSSRGIVPVVEIGGKSVGQGKVGKITSRLQVEYDAEVLITADPI